MGERSSVLSVEDGGEPGEAAGHPVVDDGGEAALGGARAHYAHHHPPGHPLAGLHGHHERAPTIPGTGAAASITPASAHLNDQA